MNRTIKRLPDSELEVMQALWSCGGPATRVQIEEILFQNHTLATTTLLTLLSRLNEKGFVRIRKEGRKSTYTPVISKADYLGTQSGRFIRTLCGGSLPVFAAALCDSGLSREELDELRALLKKEML